MRIALVPSAYHPSFGGVEEHCRQLAHALRSLGHPVIVVTNRWPRGLPSFAEVEDVPVYRLPFRTPDVGLKSKFTYGLTGGAIKRRLDGILSEQGIDIVHVHCVSSNGFYARASARSLGLPLVVTAHGELTMDAERLFERSAFARQTLRGVLADASAVSACSGHTLQELEAFWGRPFGDRGRVIYNGIRFNDIDAAAPHRQSRPYILAIGRHVFQKGFDVLLTALHFTGGLGMDLVLAGDGPEHQHLKELAVKLGIAPSVTFVGRVHHRRALELFRGCEFFVLPSRHEPFGIVNLEAMAAGKAVVATRVGGVPEVVEDGVTGMLVAPDDVRALAAAMRRLMASQQVRQRLGEAGRRRAAEFTWSAIADQYLDVYRKVYASRAKSGDVGAGARACFPRNLR